MARLPASNLLLAALPEEDRARLSPLLKAVPLETRTMFLREGQPIESVCFPQGGVCALTLTMADGRIAQVGIVGVDGLVGCLAGFGQDVAAYDAMVQIPDGGALLLPTRDFRDEMSRAGALHALVTGYMLAANAMTAASVACNALHTAEERCARWLLHAHDRVTASRFELSHEFIAMMLGVRRPTATLVAGILQRAGLIRYKRGRMEIVDRAGLEAASCECYRAVQAHFRGLLPGAADAAIPAAAR
ncbi:MAG TPA: Crp/Fnr family transcriptional regulator [Vicinamibacterales bacterium]